MESNIQKKQWTIDGMTCVNCQHKIEKGLLAVTGVKSVKVSFRQGSAIVSFDENIVSREAIPAAIEKLGYRALSGTERPRPGFGRLAGILAAVAVLYALLQTLGLLNLLVPGALASGGMGYGTLFMIGLMTSVHCVAMCGGINLSQCVPRGTQTDEKETRLGAFAPAVFYNLGRVISYTAVGFVLGLAGYVFGGANAGLPVMAQAILKGIAGAFMVIMGINMLGIFPWLRALNLKMPNFFREGANKTGQKAANKSGTPAFIRPLIVGLLNGLMPCGPLQSMQIVALASGNPFVGGLSMLVFSVGTVPLMLGLGSIVSALGKRFTKGMMDVGAVLVVVLGLAMISQGGSLSGHLSPDFLLALVVALCAAGIAFHIPFRGPSRRVLSAAVALSAAIAILVAWGPWTAEMPKSIDEGGANIGYNEQVVESTLSARGYPNITVTLGTPVRWVIEAPAGSINGCNNRINIPEYDIYNYAFQTGENIIEFTPTKTGKFPYSCWMGMIYGSITVVEGSS